MFGSRVGFSRSADRIALFSAGPNSIDRPICRRKQCARSNEIGHNLKYFLLSLMLYVYATRASSIGTGAYKLGLVMSRLSQYIGEWRHRYYRAFPGPTAARGYS